MICSPSPALSPFDFSFDTGIFHLANSPFAVIGLNRGYRIEDISWTGVQPHSEVVQKVVGLVQSFPTPGLRTSGAYILYTPQSSQTVSRSTASNPANQQPENPDQVAGQTGSGSGASFTSGDAEDDVQYQNEGGPYRQTLRRYERRGERLDNSEPGKRGEPPPRAQPRGRKR